MQRMAHLAAAEPWQFCSLASVNSGSGMFGIDPTHHVVSCHVMHHFVHTLSDFGVPGLGMSQAAWADRKKKQEENKKDLDGLSLWC